MLGHLPRKRINNPSYGGSVTHRFFVTTVDRWSAKNRAEDPHTNGDFNPDEGIPARLAAEYISDAHVDHLLLQARSDDSVGLESEQDDATGFSEVVHPPTEHLRTRSMRQEMLSRLGRRHHERDSGNLLLTLVGGSPLARDQQIADLTDTLNGLPEELSKERAALRREAARLAPHNLTELIRLPPSRGRG
jgi:hypothetical protein